MGWCRDLPDYRDFTPAHPSVRDLLLKISGGRSRRRTLPAAVDLREYLREPQDQGPLNACTSFAVLALHEYFRQRLRGDSQERSKLFLHHVAQTANQSGGGDVSIRSALTCLVRFGAPPARHWPYRAERGGQRLLDPFLYGFARDFQLLRYLRLDQSGGNGAGTLQRVKSFLAAGFPSAFGFAVPTSIGREADVLFRPEFDSVQGGQAVVAIGYDDSRRIGSHKGAILFRNSWGSDWGTAGNGWLPYAVVEREYAADFWTLLHPEWCDSGDLSVPAGVSLRGGGAS
jgi:C1A family cysteine protease